MLIRLSCPPKLHETLRKAQAGGARACVQTARRGDLVSPSWGRPLHSPDSLRRHHCPFPCLCHHPRDDLPLPPLSYRCVTLPSGWLFFLVPPSPIFGQSHRPPSSRTSPALPPSPPPSFSAVLFPLFLLLYASGGSSADLTTAQLMSPRTPTLTAPPFGRLCSFWFLTHPCSYTSTSLVVLLNLLAGTQAGVHEQTRTDVPPDPGNGDFSDAGLARSRDSNGDSLVETDSNGNWF